MEAMLLLLLVHVPPMEPSVSVRLPDEHIAPVPVIGAGLGFTVIMKDVKHPVPRV